MGIEVKITSTLLYYDGPVIFIGQDVIGTNYLCVLFEKDSEKDKYVCVPISPNRLDSVQAGEIDLRAVFEGPELPHFFVLSISDESEYHKLEDIPREHIDKTWFPEQGTFLSNKEPIEKARIVRESFAQQTAIIHYALNPPEATKEKVISTPVLANGLLLFQNMLRVAYKRTIKDLVTFKR